MNNKATITLYYLASMLFYIDSIIQLFSSGFTSSVIRLCLGSAFLCFGAHNQSKNKKSDTKDNSNKL